LYSDDVKRIIAFVYKDDRLLFNEGLTDAVIQIYTKLIKNPSPMVYERVCFLPFYSLKEKGKPFYHKIKPLLELISHTTIVKPVLNINKFSL
jgi:hypothetical protein